MPLNNQLKTPDTRLMTPKIKSLKNQLALSSTRKQLKFNKGSVLHRAEFENYEHLAIEALDDQRCYATLNNLLTTPDNRLMTPRIKSIKNQLVPSSTKKQLNFSCASKSHETGSGYYEHLAMRTPGDPTIYARLNNLLTPARIRISSDPFMTPNYQSLYSQLATPNMSIFSGSYCEIVTPLTDNRLNFTSDAMSPVSQIESVLEISTDGNIRFNLSPAYGVFPNPSKPIRGRSNKRGKITYIPSSVDPKPKTGLFSRAKKERFTRTLLTQNKQVEEEQRSDEKRSSQVVPSFKRGKLRSSLSKLKHRITMRKLIKSTSPNTSPFQKSLHHRDGNFHTSYSKTPSGKGFLSKFRNRLQNLNLF